MSATTERVLSGRTLDQPPPAYQPTLPPAAGAAAATANAGEIGARARASAGQPDLITRYNLQNRVGGKGKEAVMSEEQKRSGQGWSGDKSARAEGLKRRREEMILEARRKMMDKEGGAA